MIKVICIKDVPGALIKGKIYDAEFIKMITSWKNYTGYRLIDETGWISIKTEEYVIPLTEWREKRINDILND